MSDVNITVEVHCIRPPWGQHNPISMFNDSRYRIYINNDLITERSWIWTNDVFLSENIWIHADKNNEYILKLEPVVTIPEQAKFFLENIKFKNLIAESNKIDDLQVNFSLR